MQTKRHCSQRQEKKLRHSQNKLPAFAVQGKWQESGGQAMLPSFPPGHSTSPATQRKEQRRSSLLARGCRGLPRTDNRVRDWDRVTLVCHPAPPQTLTVRNTKSACHTTKATIILLTQLWFLDFPDNESSPPPTAITHKLSESVQAAVTKCHSLSSLQTTEIYFS